MLVVLFVIIPIVVLVLITIVYNYHRWPAVMVVTLLAACHSLNLFMYCVHYFHFIHLSFNKITDKMPLDNE